MAEAPSGCDGHPRHHQYQARQIAQRRDLRQDERADDHRNGWKQSEKKRKARSRQARHGELVAHIRNDRRTNPDADACQQELQIGKGLDGLGQSDKEAVAVLSEGIVIDYFAGVPKSALKVAAIEKADRSRLYCAKLDDDRAAGDCRGQA